MGFGFTKISIEKAESKKEEKVEISTNIDLSEIKEIESKLLKTDDKILSIKFKYGVNYNPGLASVAFEGGLLIALPKKNAEKIMKEWENKNIPDEFKVSVFNFILKKSNLKALQLEDEMNLPSHISMPSLRKSEKKSSENK